MDGPLEQIRQKIGIHKNSVIDHQIVTKPHSKTTVWRKFEIDQQNNQENQHRVLGQGKILFCTVYKVKLLLDATFFITIFT